MEIIFGIIAGIVTGMGMGGGTILILLLTLFMGLGQHASQAVNLIFFVPTSIVAIIINWKNNNINLKLGIQLAIFGIIGAIVGTVISGNMDVKLLRKIFAIFLIIIAFYEIYEIYIQYIKNRKSNTKTEEGKL